MPIKYHCPKCGKRFVEWGAEKLGFKCPDCDDEELVRVGAAEDRASRRTSLKRGTKRTVSALPTVEEDEVLVPDIEAIEEEEEELVPEEPEEAFVAADVDEAEVDFVPNPDLLTAESASTDEVDIETPEELPYGEVPTPIEEETFEVESESDEDWTS